MEPDLLEHLDLSIACLRHSRLTIHKTTSCPFDEIASQPHLAQALKEAYKS